jgi:type VI protein secretion system component VasK
MNQSFEETLEQYRQKAFAVAVSASPAFLAKLSALVLNAIETGATLDEFQAAALNLENTDLLKSWPSITPPVDWEVKSKSTPLDAAIEHIEQRSANNPDAWESDQEFMELLQKHQPLLPHERIVLTMTLFDLISQREKPVNL